jgi:xylulokinase
MAFLGIDLGTSRCKVAWVDPSGDVATAAVAVPGANEALKVGEIDPEIWWVTLRRALHQLKRLRPLNAVQGIGAIGNTPTLVLVDGRGRPLRPAILWSDARATREAQELLAAMSQSEWDRAYGVHLPMTAKYPSAKLRWLAKHEQGLLDSTKLILQPKDYINWHLCAQYACDAWSSKGVVSLDPARPTDPLVMLGLPPHLAPPVFRPVDIIGTVTRDAATVTGLPAGTPVVAGWSDQLGAVMTLAPRAGDGFVVTGTSEAAGLVTTVCPPHTSQVLHAAIWDSGLSAVYGPLTNGWQAVLWAARILRQRVATLESMASAVVDRGVPTSCPVFLPFLRGERSPVWNDAVRAMWLGLSDATTPAEMAYAVFEGIALAERDVLDVADYRPGRCRSWVGAASPRCSIGFGNRCSVIACRRFRWSR